MAGEHKRIGPFPLGMDNRKKSESLTESVNGNSVSLLRSAVNVDIDRDGKVSRREGFAKLADLAGAHSLFSHGGTLFAAAGPVLYRADAQGEGAPVFFPVFNQLLPGRVVSNTAIADRVYFSDGKVLGVVSGGVADVMPAPQSAPSLRAAAGSLPAGRYQFVASFMGPLGESAASEPEVIDVQEGAAIEVSGVPIAPLGWITQLYMTGPNGSVYSQIPAPPAGETLVISLLDLTGATCETVGLVPLPAGISLAHNNGRLLSARGNALYYSEPFAPLLCNPISGFIQFEGAVSLVMAVEGGVFVVADRTFWFAGDITEASPVEVLPYGGLPHSGRHDPKRRDTCYWFGSRGLVRASGDGSAVAVQEPRLALAGGSECATHVREREGEAHVLAAVRDPSRSRAAAGAYFEAEIIRKGVVR